MNRIFVAALKEETPNLDFFHYTGVGKINATYNLKKIIDKYKPNEIINFGTAGAVSKNLKGIIECTKFYQRDMDVSALMNLKIGQTPFDDINEIINSNDGLSCGSGDNFVTQKIKIEVDVVDMEAYALAKICKLENINFRCFKFISDNADETASNDWVKNCKKGAKLFKHKLKELNLL
jgi:adenosylhomocysteine nucleosidase|tara:strand:- start:981 stop:1514 length:534 start_codon:yes stop_codon:yes gene_type:complete